MYLDMIVLTLWQKQLELFPDTQVTIGPAIENGFYYDFARKQPFTTDDFKSIENKMHEIINKGSEFRKEFD